MKNNYQSKLIPQYVNNMLHVDVYDIFTHDGSLDWKQQQYLDFDRNLDLDP